MISPKYFFDFLTTHDITFFTGVPDSLLKDFCAYVENNTAGNQTDQKNGRSNHVIAANEGNAVAIASGVHLATGSYAAVYMQNSGQGNAINPIASLADPEVYSIPMLLIIGWRGEPGTEDEPQHKKQGKITLSLLESLGIPYGILPKKQDDAENVVAGLLRQMKLESRPVALVVKQHSFEPYPLRKSLEKEFPLTREHAIALIAEAIPSQAVIISTTGKTSRELFEYRERHNHGHAKDFLTVGSMGHCSSIALGIALQQPQRDVCCFDGDGALIMHMGALAVIGAKGPKNLKHIIFNNGSHDSVGGQPTAGFFIDIPKIALACGYKSAFFAENEEQLRNAVSKLISSQGPAILEVKVAKGSRKDLGRPTATPLQNKKAFMEFLNNRK